MWFDFLFISRKTIFFSYSPWFQFNYRDLSVKEQGKVTIKIGPVPRLYNNFMSVSEQFYFLRYLYLIFFQWWLKYVSFSKILNIGYIKQTDLVTRWKNRRLQFFNFQQCHFPIHSVPSSLTESLKACTLTFFFTQLGKTDIISLSNIVHSKWGFA